MATIAFQVWRLSHSTPPAEIVLPSPTASSNAGFSPQPRSYELKPPAQATVGKVLTVLGEAEKQPRDQDEAVVVTPELQIQETERITTKSEAEVTMSFPDQLRITAEANTIIAFLSTDPAHFLVRQDEGTATYSTDTKTATISARFRSGLFTISNGTAQVTTDPATDEAAYTVETGTGLFGYIDRTNKTQIVTIPAGSTLSYDDNTKSVSLD